MDALQAPQELMHSGMNGRGHNGHNGHIGSGRDPGPETGVPPELQQRRNSLFPFLLDVGVVLALFGLVILRPVHSPLAGDLAIGAGIVLALAALAGWAREAGAEYRRLRD